MIGIWHPDRYAQNPRLHEKATEKLKELNVAYNELITGLTSGTVKGDVKPKTTNHEAHLIIVTCPGCQKKNRIKAGFVTRHPRCGNCRMLLFQNKQARQNAGGTINETDDRSHGTASTNRTSGKKPFSEQASFQDAPAFKKSFSKRKRRFWNKWTILLSIISIGMLIANADDIHNKSIQGLKQISEGRYARYFKDPSLAPLPPKKIRATTSADILHIQKALKKYGYDTKPLDGIWGERTLAAVQQFRKDYFLEFRVDDVSEIARALQRQHAIITLHPDWPHIAKDKRFRLWTEQQIMTSPKICRELLASGKVHQVGSVIDWYKFDLLQPKPVTLPRNGTLKKNYHKGLAPLTITTRNDGRHYYLKLLNASNGSETLTAFMKSGSTIAEHVPIGKYELKYAVGDDWYGTRWLFGPETVFKKMDRVFEFKIQNNEIAGYRLELFLQVTSPADTRKGYAFDF